MDQPKQYAVLPLESTNRVYAGQAGALLVAELSATAPTMHTQVTNAGEQILGGVPYVVFAGDALDEHDRFILSNLSATRALFELRDDGALLPIEVTPLAHFDSDLVTIQRYNGKTNEQFTHLVVNLTVAASSAAAERSAQGLPTRLLDPVAGRGTTLNRALIAGHDVSGVEIAAADFDQYRTFLTTYLKNHRVKHKKTEEKVRKGPLKGTDRWTVTIAGRQSVEMVRGDTERAADFFPARSFDVVVGDLPYGVQHRAAAGDSSARSPLELVERALSGWRTVMRSGAALGLAWNVKTLPRRDLVAAVEQHGFEVVEHPRSFEHVVDRSITRDVLVARRS